MGTWGAGLYDDDYAADLKNTIALLCKVPAEGPWFLEKLKAMHYDGHSDDVHETTFWVVAADQFERKGIACEEASATALDIIANGRDLAHAQDLGADEKFLKKRRQVLEELAGRLRAPRAIRSKSRPAKAPDMVLSTGEIYVFPTMNRRGWHPYRTEQDGPFVPDGWGAIVVLATGRAFDWLPWCALSALTVNPERKPTFDDALQATLIHHLQTEGAGKFVPKRAHARGLALELLGKVELDADLVVPVLSRWPVEQAIALDWSIAYAAWSAAIPGLPRGCELASLIKRHKDVAAPS